MAWQSAGLPSMLSSVKAFDAGQSTPIRGAQVFGYRNRPTVVSYDMQQLIKIERDFPSLKLVLLGEEGAPLASFHSVVRPRSPLT